MAAPLDDRIAAFKSAPAQTEAAVAGVLQAGRKEGRSVEAWTALRPWLAQNPVNAQSVLFDAARAAEYAGDGQDAVGFYRKLLKSPRLDGRLAAAAAPAAYRLLLNNLRDPDAAYLFMREEGDRLRAYGEARQFDPWFLDQALKRQDLAATASRLAVIYNTKDEDLPPYAGYLDALLKEIETFRHHDDALDEAIDKLSAAARCPPGIKARWEWAKAVAEYSPKAAELFLQRKEIPAELLQEPLHAAKALTAQSPFEGSLLVARGWVQFNHGDTPTFLRFVHARRDLKAEPILQALQRLPLEQAKQLLNAPFHGPRGRGLKVATFFSADKAPALVARMPAVFNALDAPEMPLWDPEMPVEEAKALAPNLLRNPHPDAALVRAYAVAGTHTVKALVPVMMRSERWRFSDAKTAVETAWRSGADKNGADYNALVKQYAAQGARHDQLKKQVSKDADSRQRMAAFNALYQELLRGNPSTPALMSLWDALCKTAPIPDKIAILTKLTSDLHAETLKTLKSSDRASLMPKELQRYLLARALGQMQFGNTYATLRLRPDIQDRVFYNWSHYGKGDLRRNLAGFASRLGELLKKQLEAGTLSEPLFGIWLHCVQPNSKEAKALMRDLVKSPAYARIDSAYREMAADGQLFGSSALTGPSATDPRHLSRELLNLPTNAAPAQVAAALKTVVTRVKQASEPVAVYGLKPVAKLPELTGETRALALSLFAERAPLGGYPGGQGYGELVVRLAGDLRKAKAWGAIEPYAAAFWRGIEPDGNDREHYPRAEKLVQFAEAALADGAVSPAAAVARNGLRSRSRALVPGDDRTGGKERWGRLRQVAGKAGLAIGAFEIPVDETDPDYPIYKSSAEFAQANLDSAWALYQAHADRLNRPPRGSAEEGRPLLLRKMPVSYGFWLLQRNMEADRTDRAETLVKELTIWSREAEGTFSPEQEAELKLVYADIAFRRGALPTARAWYRKVADARQYEGSEMHVRAVLGSVGVDRASKDFASALADLDKLMRREDPSVRMRVHYARAQVFMDQEKYAEALDEIESVLRTAPSHADALILRGKIQYRMRKLEEASEIELGVTQENKIMVPGETLKINLNDPTLRVSGLGADIEVEVRAKSGDRERLMLHQLGDEKEKFRAEVPTVLGPPVPGDKILQVLGVDEIRYGYSKDFRAKMKDLPPDPDVVIGIASDAQLALSAGALPPREGERRLNIDELGLSTAQKALGTRCVRPGNPVYLRVIDPDQSKTAKEDEVVVSLASSSGDLVRRVSLKETGPYTGTFEAVVPTAPAQALAFASESAPGRDPNMAISARDYPGWLGKVGDPEKARTFGVDLNDNVALGTMSLRWGDPGSALTRFVLQTSMNGRDWTTGTRYPDDPAPWDGRPRVSSFPTYSGGIAVSAPKGRELPRDWQEKMALTSARASCRYRSAAVTNWSTGKLPIVNCGHPNYSGLVELRLLFYQPAAAIRRFRLKGYPAADEKGNVQTIFLLDGKPADESSDDPLFIQRELTPGLHEIQVWRHAASHVLEKAKPVLLCDVAGQDELAPCPGGMFDPATFPEGVRAALPQPATVTAADGGLDVAFGTNTQARLVRLVIYGFKGVAPQVKSVTLTDRDGNARLPVEKDFMALRENGELEVLPGDQVTARYEDPCVATPGRNRHERRLQVAYNTATITASFLKYKTTETGRELELESIRRFAYGDAVAVVIDDPDLDASPEPDTVEFTVATSAGTTATMKAVETEAHSGRFIGRVFPVAGKPARASEIQVPEGGALTATYRDMENLDPGIPADRTVTIEHAQYVTPALGAYTVRGEALSTPREPAPETAAKPAPAGERNARGATPEAVRPRRSLSYDYIDPAALPGASLQGVIGAPLRFDVVAPHLALAASSEITAYVQVTRPTGGANEDPKDAAAKPGAAAPPFDIGLPGTLKLAGTLRAESVAAPRGYKIGAAPRPPSNKPPLDEGRFSFSVPLLLGDRPTRSFATKDAESLSAQALPEGLAVRAGDVVRIGYAYQDPQGAVQWETATVKVVSDAFLDVMDGDYNSTLASAFVGEKVYVRVLAPGLDRGPDRDDTTVSLKAASGAAATFPLRETEAHTGVFKGAFTLRYADQKLPAELPPVALNGLPVRYGDEVTVTYEGQSGAVRVNRGADGRVEPFSKRYTGDQMAVQTGFTMAECYFELAKQHREMEQESLSRREIGHARKLLAEAVATHHDPELKAHAEYLLGNLAQEYADLAKNDEARRPMYEDALARFTKIPIDYPDTEFAPKAQFKKALVYEKMGETEIAVEEYVKLAYKYPDCEYIPEVMARLGAYFQKKGQAYKVQADPLREKTDERSKAEVLRLEDLARPEYLKAAQVFAKLQQRFPDHGLAGLAGLRAAQNYMRAQQYEKAIDAFELVMDNESYDGPGIRAQAIYWCGLSYERLAGAMSEGNWKGRGNAMDKAYQRYRRATFDFPDSKWAKFSRGRLADPVFERKIEIETKERERLIKALKE